jgi:hypothetical protein
MYKGRFSDFEENNDELYFNPELSFRDEILDLQDEINYEDENSDEEYENIIKNIKTNSLYESVDYLEETIYKDLIKTDDINIQQAMSVILFDLTKDFYKEKFNIVIPSYSKKVLKRWMIVEFFSTIRKTIWNIFNRKNKIDLTDNNISYFNDLTTTDVLDSCITEIPIEQQILKEEGCGSAKNLNNNVIEELEDLFNESQKLGIDITEKYKIKLELENKVKLQEEILKKNKSLNEWKVEDIEDY